MSTTRTYFQSLDALRFFAFFMVFLHHLPVHHVQWLRFFQHSGGFGVTFFFVLSGFLISYLALWEKEQTQSFEVKNFLIRRMLRIWPLYFAMVLFAFATPFILSWLDIGFSDKGYKPNYWYTVSFLENIRMIQENQMPNVSPLPVMWSLCVEEHFYLIWAVLFAFIKPNKFHWFCFVGMGLSVLAKVVFVSQGWPFQDVFTNLDTFCIGGVLAYAFYYHREAWIPWVQKIPNWVKGLLIILLWLLVFLSRNLEVWDDQWVFSNTIISLVFASILILFLPQEGKFKIKSSSWFSYLGKISYGLYLTHTIVIMALLKVFSSLNLPLNNNLMAVGFFVVALLVSIVFSMILYHFLEKPFLKLKEKFKS